MSVHSPIESAYAIKEDLRMSDPLDTLLDEAIRHELTVSQLYFEFFQAFPDDADLWWTLSVEENGHAGLLEAGRKLFGSEYGEEILPARIEYLTEANLMLDKLLEQMKDQPLSREAACRIALEIETTTDGMIFENALEPAQDSEVLTIAERIRRDDERHAARIRAYMKDQGISEA
jgi:rubrerythrin